MKYMKPYGISFIIIEKKDGGIELINCSRNIREENTSMRATITKMLSKNIVNFFENFNINLKNNAINTIIDTKIKSIRKKDSLYYYTEVFGIRFSFKIDLYDLGYYSEYGLDNDGQDCVCKAIIKRVEWEG